MYLVVAETEMYGPETRLGYVSGPHDSLDYARRLAADHDPDYDETVQCHRLAHNQAAATRGAVYEVMAVGNPYTDWTNAPHEVSGTAEEVMMIDDDDDDPDTIMDNAIAEHGMVVIGSSDELYTCRRVDELLGGAP